jgi:hypothetical protein
MKSIEIFDPALCCSSGVCGPRVDPVLLRVTSDVNWLKKQGVPVTRYNLAQQPQAFAANETVKAALAANPEHALPLVLIDGQIVSRGAYPKRDQLAAWLGLTTTEPVAIS